MPLRGHQDTILWVYEKKRDTFWNRIVRRIIKKYRSESGDPLGASKLHFSVTTTKIYITFCSILHNRPSKIGKWWSRLLIFARRCRRGSGVWFACRRSSPSVRDALHRAPFWAYVDLHKFTEGYVTMTGYIRKTFFLKKSFLNFLVRVIMDWFWALEKNRRNRFCFFSLAVSVVIFTEIYRTFT